MNARDVLPFTPGLHSDQLSGVLVDRRDVFSPRADLSRAVPCLALVDDDAIVGKERDECVEVARGLGSKVPRDDNWGGDCHEWSSHQRGPFWSNRYIRYTANYSTSSNAARDEIQCNCA